MALYIDLLLYNPLYALYPSNDYLQTKGIQHGAPHVRDELLQGIVGDVSERRERVRSESQPCSSKTRQCTAYTAKAIRPSTAIF
jgi:hypothetical protein